MASRWFHASLTGKQAEDLLMTAGSDGSFLVRPSENTPGNFSISVRFKGEVTHIKIQNDGDWYCLAGSPDPFATLVELVTHYMNTPESIKEKRGGFIELLYPLRSTDPTAERWFHGTISAKEAERLLLAKGKQGSYLVRESQSMPGQFALAVRCHNGVHHVIINHKEGKFFVALSHQFDTLAELVEFYVENPKLHDIKDKTPIKLREPFHSTSFVASSIKERMEVLEKPGKRGVTGFREEFEHIQHFDHNDGVYACNAGQLEENAGKNRYKNILPYDHSRVLLKGGNPKEPGRDYINANYIDAELSTWKARYIAAQGPLPNTIGHFWTMIYQHGSSIVVMLTNEIEGGKAKCAKYWPDLGLSAEYDKIIIDNMLEHDSSSFTMRELRVYHADKAKKAPHMVYHYHFTNWPDHGVPDDPGVALGLLNEVHMKHKLAGNVNSPMVFHCSAGIGRTGTVIVIDILMHLLDEQGLDGEIDIQKNIRLMRTQRSGMIQTEVQYRFVYESIAHYIDTEQKRLKAKQDSPVDSKNVYGNIDFPAGRRDASPVPQGSSSPRSPRSPVPDRPVPRPPPASVRERSTQEREDSEQKSATSPHRVNAMRSRVQTDPGNRQKGGANMR